MRGTEFSLNQRDGQAKGKGDAQNNRVGERSDLEGASSALDQQPLVGRLAGDREFQGVASVGLGCGQCNRRCRRAIEQMAQHHTAIHVDEARQLCICP